MPKTKSPCEHCGIEMEYFTSSYSPSGRKRFCSRDCQKKASRTWTICPICGKRFWYHNSWPRKYCSSKCAATVNVINIKRMAHKTGKVTVICQQCGKNIERWRSEARKIQRHFCSHQCFGVWLSSNKTGSRHHNFNRVERTCEVCTETFTSVPSEIAKGWNRCCSMKCRAKWQKEHPPDHLPPVMRGSDHPCWKGGREPYYGPNWRPQRRKARERDGYRCQRCGITEQEHGREMDVHHIVPFREFGIERYEEANRLKNLISYCNICHLIVRHNGPNPRSSLLPSAVATPCTPEIPTH